MVVFILKRVSLKLQSSINQINYFVFWFHIKYASKYILLAPPSTREGTMCCMHSYHAISVHCILKWLAFILQLIAESAWEETQTWAHMDCSRQTEGGDTMLNNLMKCTLVYSTARLITRQFSLMDQFISLSSTASCLWRLQCLSWSTYKIFTLFFFWLVCCLASCTNQHWQFWTEHTSSHVLLASLDLTWPFTFCFFCC